MFAFSNLSAARRYQISFFTCSFLAFPLFLLFLSVSVFALPGELDPSFAGGGVTPSKGANYFSAAGIAIQPDGKIVVAGVYFPSLKQPYINAQFVVSRYLPTGLPDYSFGANVGTVVTSFKEYQATFLTVNDIALLPGGKIVVVGSGRVPNQAAPSVSRTNLFVALYNADGSLDTTFNGTGKFTSAVGGGLITSAEAVAAQPDGKFVVAGYAGGAVKGDVPYKSLLMRFSGEGLDSAFGNGGTVLTAFSGGNARNFSVAVQPDGKIVAGGIADSVAIGFGLCLARYDALGNLDSGFGSGGFAIANSNGLGEAGDVLIQPDGKITAIASAGFGNNRDFAVVRFNSDGTLDFNFGTNGKVIAAVTNLSDEAMAGALQPDGKIVVAGYSHNYNGGSNINPALVRFSANGVIDSTFGMNGVISAPAGISLSDVSLMPDGKIMTVSSNAVVGGNLGYRAVRYLGDAPFTARRANFDFDGDGWADFGTVRAVGNAMYWFATENPSLEILAEKEFGMASDKIAPADYDGDRKTDLAIFRNGMWLILKSLTGTITNIQLGQSGDLPIPADYDGDGKADAAVFSQGIWQILNSASNSLRTERLGLAADKPIIGDFDGDGKSDITIYRNGMWYQLRSLEGGYTEKFGVRTDKPVAADYDGDGKTDVAFFRPSEGTWHIKYSGGGGAPGTIEFGTSADVLVPADYDGDGKTDIAVRRDFMWFILQSASGFRAERFGHATDFPIPAAYIR